ncbi:hypothetical protein NDU88_007950 [Pleurodeles waltl]|uniref:Secreted protein n=1 Tax=Pleurodeles waltl TaxID=8319 RepID=A0AAV7VR62_PLEWA|nr:hypothetical protein NDU88_007950 [Pleurodeles waltl]
MHGPIAAVRVGSVTAWRGPVCLAPPGYLWLLLLSGTVGCCSADNPVRTQSAPMLLPSSAPRSLLCSSSLSTPHTDGHASQTGRSGSTPDPEVCSLPLPSTVPFR